MSGETSGTNRLEFLDNGIAAILANRTNGLALVIEHRYYGQSYPVPNLETHQLRFLDTAQGLQDVVTVATTLEIDGTDFSSPGHQWILYGGSYAGGQAAFLRSQFPHVFTGAIASSGVVVAKTDFWEYFGI